MNVHQNVANFAPILGVIDPDVSTAAAYSTAYVDAGLYAKLYAIVFAGTLGTSATINAKFEQATTSGGSGVKDVTGTAITAITEAGGQSDKQASIELDPAVLDVAGGFRWVRLTVTVAVATSDMGAVLLGIGPRYEAPTDAASVVQVLRAV